MPTDRQFDELLREPGLPSQWSMGFEWDQKFVFEGDDRPQFYLGRQTFSQDGVELAGNVKVDGSQSVQKTIAGPFVEHDAPTGIIPSTLFTPFPRDILGIDFEYIQLLALVAMATAFGAISPELADAN